MSCIAIRVTVPSAMKPRHGDCFHQNLDGVQVAPSWTLTEMVISTWWSSTMLISTWTRRHDLGISRNVNGRDCRFYAVRAVCQPRRCHFTKTTAKAISQMFRTEFTLPDRKITTASLQ